MKSQRVLSTCRARHESGQDHGFILVVVLLILTATATLASIYSVYATNTAASARVPEDRLRAEAAFRAGVELVVLQLLSTPEASRPTRGTLGAQFAGARVSATYVSEGARIDLNAAPKELLSGLFASFGISKDKADGYADHVVAWRTRMAPNAANPEVAAYQAVGLSYRPRQAPFESTRELNLVRDLPHELAEKAMPFVTVFSALASIDVMNAKPEVLSALPGVTQEQLSDILSAREKGENVQSLLRRLGQARALATAAPAKSMRARIFVELGRRRVSADVVFALTTEGEDPYEILYWRDDFDGPLPDD